MVRIYTNLKDMMDALKVDELYALEHMVGSRALDDEDVVMKVVAVNGMLLQYVSSRMRACKKVFMCALNSNTDVVEFFGGNFLDDKEVMMRAVELDGMLLEFASDRLRADADMIRVAVLRSKRAHVFAIDYDDKK